MSKFNTPVLKLVTLLLTFLSLAACNGGSTDSTTLSDTTTTDDTTTEASTDLIVEVDPFNFESDALISSISTQTCTLSNGDEASCYKIDIAGAPSNYEIGVFCPKNITSTADEAGIWFDGGGEVYDITGDFILNLPTLYNDSHWQLYDEGTGLVNITDTQESCDGAARPNVEEQYQNHCVECSIDYVNGGISESFLIPITPVASTQNNSIGNTNVGVALNGVVLAAPAPVDAILGAYTIAAFDDCAGHINLVAGYHYHGEAGCSQTQIQSDGHAAMMGYALDGFGIFGMLNEDNTEPTDLDECRGHSDDTRGYHYHAADVAENMFIGCFKGAIAR
ncbi:YHYH protein [Pseudoalteromonas carrageenovora]|uniref:YHYH protein n=1 Tax=Pseudoalteromonas carrageenovora TaxID=227 RepID=UPI0026E25CDD|nr:YHYH protein [Pseudoalteromonas carrageenovora]MDO6547879.1 YHYH protein [Pseudoalteromonas carrageenovora]MDO6832186.1 YHYH protein [Pseudoalteromonas carrageenovora]